MHDNSLPSLGHVAARNDQRAQHQDPQQFLIVRYPLNVSKSPPRSRFHDEERDFHQTRSSHWDNLHASQHKTGKYYHSYTQAIYRNLIPEGSSVLEIGSGSGDLLAALKPSTGIGVDFSQRAVKLASKTYPELSFVVSEVGNFRSTLPPDSSFDFVILSDLVNDLWDVQSLFEEIAAISSTETRIILNFHSHLWAGPLRAAQKLGLMRQMIRPNWLTVSDIRNLMDLTGLEAIKQWDEILIPIRIPIFSKLANRFLAKIWPIRYLDLSHFVVARRQTPRDVEPSNPSVTILIPARNEEGHIDEIIERTPEMGCHTQLLFVEGGSQDATRERIERAIEANPAKDISVLTQQGRGKGDAVRLGFSQASGDILMILDADMTVPPEDLPRFYDAIVKGRGDFVNGVRLVYPMSDDAMRFLNLAGNKFFSFAFTWLLGQPVRDTLCGTKVLRRRDYEKIQAHRAKFGDFDPFGDFDLIFGASHIHLKFIEVPIRYRSREYGQTNIRRWRHGVLLLRMTQFAAFKLKFPRHANV